MKRAVGLTDSQQSRPSTLTVWLKRKTWLVQAIGVVAICLSAVIQSGDLAQMFRSPWAWLLNAVGVACAVWLKKTWFSIAVIVVILWPVVIMLPLFALTFGAP